MSATATKLAPDTNRKILKRVEQKFISNKKKLKAAKQMLKMIKKVSKKDNKFGMVKTSFGLDSLVNELTDVVVDLRLAVRQEKNTKKLKKAS